jgi:hypothetical protein
MDGISKPYLAYPNCTTSVQNLYVSRRKSKEVAEFLFIYLFILFICYFRDVAEVAIIHKEV